MTDTEPRTRRKITILGRTWYVAWRFEFIVSGPWRRDRSRILGFRTPTYRP